MLEINIRLYLEITSLFLFLLKDCFLDVNNNFFLLTYYYRKVSNGIKIIVNCVVLFSSGAIIENVLGRVVR